MPIDAEGASLDPKTWLNDDASRSAEPSFDVRNWAAPPPAGAVPADAAPPAPPARPRAPAPAWLPAAGSGLLVLAAGAGLALATRSPEAAPAPTEVAAAPAEPAPGAIASRRTLVLAGVAELPDALLSAGLPAAEVRSLSQRLLGALGAAAGEVRLVLDLEEAAGATRLLGLEATRGDGAGIALARAADGTLAAERLSAALTTRVNVVRGEMDGESFYTSAVAAGVTDSLISDFANAFSFDFNLQTEVNPGDVFEAAFEQAYNPSGQAVGVPKLLYVSLSTAAKSRTLYRFVPPGEREAGWFDGAGRSIVKALMLTPVDGARISSKFGPRFHPVLHFMKMHGGTDFAAPIGTPIYAAGSGVVEYAQFRGAGGNQTAILHDNGWRTLYLHQNSYAPGIAAGVRVAQGQKIGEIGTTGRSTGPHLHYEVHIDGERVDPMSIDTGTGRTLTGPALQAFTKERDRIDAARAKPVA